MSHSTYDGRMVDRQFQKVLILLAALKICYHLCYFVEFAATMPPQANENRIQPMFVLLEAKENIINHNQQDNQQGKNSYWRPDF